MVTVGLDLHERYITACALDNPGTGVCMISAGFETTDPMTQTRTVVIQGARETSGRGWVLEVHNPQGAAAFLSHVHRTWTETFEILQGFAICRVGAAEHRLAAGESIVMPLMVPHVHPWNAGTGVMVYRQTDRYLR